MRYGTPAIAIAWAIGFVVLMVLVYVARRTRRSGGSMTAGVAGAIWDLQTDQKRQALEVIVNKRAAAHDPEDADGNLPELDRPEHSDDFSLLEFRGWQRVAGKFQDTWAGLTTRFLPSLLDAARVREGMRVLDVACGPGVAAEAATDRGAVATGVDFSPEMITIARARCPEVDFRRGDAQDLAFDDGQFDAVVMNFGVLHLPHPERAFVAAARVLRAGGRYAFTVWAEPDESPGAAIVQQAIAAHGRLDVEVPKGPDHLRHGRLRDWRHLLGQCGFDPESVTVDRVGAEWEVPTDFFLFEAERHAGVRTAALLAAQTPDALVAIERQMTQSVRAFATDDGFAIPYTAYVVSAAKG
jgi:SAM-dependent methyltransferase